MNDATTMTIMAMLLLTASAATAFADEQETPRKQDPTTAEPQTTKEEKPKDAKPQPKEEPAITVSLRDGIHFRSSDGNLDSTLGGYMGLHYRYVSQRPDDNVRTSPDSWFLRQARIDLAGAVYKDFDFRIVIDIPTGSNGSTSTAALTDAFIGWRRHPELSFRLGQFKEPFGQEQTTGDRVVEFAERSESDRFTPQRDIGAMVYGRLFDGILGYEAGWFNGNGRSVVDSNKGKELAGRLRVMPFATADESFLFKNLRFGVAATTASVQQSSINGLDATSQYLAIFYLDATAGTLDGERKRLGAEFNWNSGPFGLRGEAWRRVDHVDVGTLNNRRLDMTAWIASATWLVTGEKKPLESWVDPMTPFDPSEGTWGALEIAFRADRLKFSNEIFTTGVASAAGNSNGVTAYTFGLNWFLTRHIRISPDLFWEVYDDPIRFSTGRTDRHFFGGILRFQLEF